MKDFEPMQSDRHFVRKYITLIVLITLIIIAASVGLYIWLEHHLSFLVLIFLFNTFVILKFAKVGISMLLFPYGSAFVKFQHHQTMNLKMSKEMIKVIDLVKAHINELKLEDHKIVVQQFPILDKKPHPIKKLIDYMTLFSEVNAILIENDKNKVSRGKKKTNRYPISDVFVEATEKMVKILDLFKELKIISLTELKRARTASEVVASTKIGYDMEKHQPDAADTTSIELRSIWDHYYDLDKIEAETFDSLHEMRQIKDVVKNVSILKPFKLVAAPIFFMSDKHHKHTKNAEKQTKEILTAKIQELENNLDRLVELS